MLSDIKPAENSVKFRFVFFAIIILQGGNPQAFPEAPGAQEKVVFGIEVFQFFDKGRFVCIEIVFLKVLHHSHQGRNRYINALWMI